MGTTPSTQDFLTDACCAKVQLAVSAQDQAVNKIKPVGTFEALTSERNKSGFNTIIPNDKDRPTTSSFRKIYTEGIRPQCDLDSTADDKCADPNTTETDVSNLYATAEHTVELSIKREFAMDVQTYEKFCKSPERVMGDWLAANKWGVMEEINRKIVGRVVGYVGEYDYQTAPDNSILNPITLNIMNNENGVTTFNPFEFAKIQSQFDKLGVNEAPLLIGDGYMGLAALAQQYYPGTNQAGGSISSIPFFYKDMQINKEMGGGVDHLLAIAPRTLQFVTYNDIKESDIRYSVPNDREKFIIENPFGLGLDWDYYLDIGRNGCFRNMKFQLWFDVICPNVFTDCFKKPVLHFLTNCGQAACPTPQEVCIQP